MVVVQGLSEAPVELEVQIVLVSHDRQQSELGSELFFILVRGGYNGGERADWDGVRNHANQHQDNAEALLCWTLRRDVAVANCRDGRYDEVKCGEVLLIGWGVIEAVSVDPCVLIEVIDLGYQKPETREIVAEDEEEEEEGAESLDLHSAGSELGYFFLGGALVLHEFHDADESRVSWSYLTALNIW